MDCYFLTTSFLGMVSLSPWKPTVDFFLWLLLSCQSNIKALCLLPLDLHSLQTPHAPCFLPHSFSSLVLILIFPPQPTQHAYIIISCSPSPLLPWLFPWAWQWATFHCVSTNFGILGSISRKMREKRKNTTSRFCSSFSFCGLRNY